uniref:Protein transport protein SEC24 n=1 Tax=Hemiselmis tepida TaxID=464990 RepID=A0A7S0W6H9_9CRYP
MSLPIAVSIQPLAPIPHDEDQVALVSDHSQGPIRCRRCRAYINCHVRFVDGGRHWSCNLCGMSNAVEPDYFCTLDAHGVRRDAAERPELSKGSVDFAASQEYYNRPAMAPAVMFAIEVSATAVRGGLLHATVQAVRESVEAMSKPGATDPRTLVGVLTFDAQIHFYNLHSDFAGDTPPMSVLSDVEDPFLATPASLVCLKDKLANVLKLLDALPGLFANTQIGESAAGAAARAASLALADNGGRVVCVFASPPTLGVGRLARLDDPNAVGSDREKRLHGAECKFYSAMAEQCCASQVSVDLFCCTSLYTDLASMAAVCRATGGGVHYIPRLGQDNGSSYLRLLNELKRTTLRPTGYEAVLRVRCSAGLAVTDYFGSFHKTPEGDIELPVISCDKTLAVTFKVDGDMSGERSHAAIQCALLYTASDGTRRIRVHTISAPVTNNISAIFKSADLDALVNVTSKQAVGHCLTHSAESARQSLVHACVQMLFVYRKFCATNPAPGQLILPESLKLLPLYTLAMMKSKVLTADNAIVRTDERVYMMDRVLSLSCAETAVFAYPRMIPLHSLAPDHGVVMANGEVAVPPAMSLSGEKLDPAGAFLVENGESMVLWIGTECPPSFIEQVFGIPGIPDNEAPRLVLQPRGNALSAKICTIVDHFRQERPSCPTLTVVRQKDAFEPYHMCYLVEDRQAHIVSYVDFLCHIHSQIQTKLT